MFTKELVAESIIEIQADMSQNALTDPTVLDSKRTRRIISGSSWHAKSWLSTNQVFRRDLGEPT